MKLLLLGSGGREHALGWKIAQSPLIEQLYIAPGNVGTQTLGQNIAIDPCDFTALKEFCCKNEVTVVVVGPEAPLVQGVYDSFKADDSTKHITVIGPSKKGAQLEGSKEFAKAFMQKYNIPTAKYKSITQNNIEEGFEFLESLKAPYVLKADGLCAGKGVLILDSLDEAKSELQEMLSGRFGQASTTVVIEEFLSGIECSVFVLTDGVDYKILPVAKDYKRIGEGDIGLNTGGMGSISPVHFADEVFMEKVRTRIVEPTVHGIQKENIDYLGFIFVGVISVDNEPMVIEYNVRMGDPETESVMLRIKSDLVELFQGIQDGTLQDKKLVEDQRHAACVVMVSGGYPEEFKNGYEITGTESTNPDTLVFHSGTKSQGETILTNGGRVLAVSSYGKTMQEALNNSYQKAKEINFKDKYFRTDLGFDLK